MKISLRPSRSAKRPPSSRKPPKVIVYAVITHCSPLAEKWSAREIEGSATVTIETSRTVMKYATQTMARTSQRRPSWAEAVSFMSSSDPVETDQAGCRRPRRGTWSRVSSLSLLLLDGVV
jgi:hypothetical protein